MLAPKAAYALWAATYPPHAHNPVMHAEQRAMLALMPASLTGMTVLDAGCGTARYTHHALHRDAYHVTGVDLSPAMLRRAFDELPDRRRVTLAEASLTALPLPDTSVDLTLCGLVIGHLPALAPALGELHRVTRTGGTVLISDIHPTGQALGWQRDFKVDGQRHTVQHSTHRFGDWHAACRSIGFAMEHVCEPMLDAADIPPGARFDPIALQVPVAMVLQLRRLDPPFESMP